MLIIFLNKKKYKKQATVDLITYKNKFYKFIGYAKLVYKYFLIHFICIYILLLLVKLLIFRNKKIKNEIIKITGYTHFLEKCS